MFVAKADGELTQVDFWHLYKDVFAPHQERFPLLVASDVIKNVNVVFPQAQAMVLPGPPQRFVVRGVDRRKDPIPDERFKCHWERAHCTAGVFNSPGALAEHLQEHINTNAEGDTACLWKTCPRKLASKPILRAHVTTHLSGSQPLPPPPSQSDFITLSPGSYPYPTSTPTQRPPPPPGKTEVTFQKPSADPPSSCLTALLCIRALFRASFASTDTAPRADADHFGFPGLVEDGGDDQGADADADTGDAENAEREGERRGRRAFMVVRALMESVRLKDDVLMSWITEMVEAGMTGRS
jgi:chromatin structure-remodeling complex subunit RSC9